VAKLVNVEDISRLLQEYVQSGNLNFLIGSGASLPAIELAGDIESDIDKLLGENKPHEANLLACDFIQNLESQSVIIGTDADGADSSTTLKFYVDFLSVVDELLFERKTHLLPRQANIFTTNYDLYMEHAATRLPSLILNDGFDRSSSTIGEYRFAPEQFRDRIYRSGAIYTRQSEVPAVNLFKLHGSLNWKRKDSEIVLQKDAVKALSDEEKAKPEAVSTALRCRAVILPNMLKFGSTLLDRVYYDLLRFFSNSVEKENSVLIAFGFSFADDHILDITRRALRNPTSQLIVFAHSPAAAQSLEIKFESQRNVIIVSPEEDEVIDFPKFASLLKEVGPGQSNND